MIHCICKNCGAEGDLQWFATGFEVGYYDVNNGINWGSVFIKFSCECGAYGESQLKQ